jgi:hypothetical protein
MKYGSMIMNLKLSISHHIGYPLPCHNWKEHAKCTAEPKWCWLFSWIIRICAPWVCSQDQTVDQHFFYKCWDISVLQCYKWLQKWESSKWQIHHDNAPSHSAQLVWQFLAKDSTSQVRQRPCMPGMCPCYFFCFVHLNLERQEIWWYGNNQMQCNWAAVGDLKDWVWGVIPALAGTVEHMCMCWRSLVLRVLTPHSCKYSILVFTLQPQYFSVRPHVLYKFFGMLVML